jgi:putative flippase GtrA
MPVDMKRFKAEPRLVRFFVSGISAAVVYYAVAWSAVEQLGWKPLAAGLVAYLTALPMAYLLHRMFTFRSRSRIPAESSRFVATSLIGIGLSSVLPTMMTKLGVPLASALAVTCVVVPAANYLALSRWTFAQARGDG